MVKVWVALLQSFCTVPKFRSDGEIVRQLAPIAAELGGTMAQLALAWCLKNPDVSTVITGASRVEQVHENLQSLELVPKLTDEVMARIEAILGNKPTVDRI